MKPLIVRTPDGRKVAVPSTPPNGAPNPPRQPRNGHDGGPEPTRERRAKITEDEVRAIRADYAAGRWKQPDLAYIYGVTQSTISSVVTGDTWRDVTTEPQPQEQES